ncbi:omega-amidase, chloroplastic [Tanacetum coccineum]|uniref:Omega-amidase, chloroplastic n=1 Tax=Tanacetum coccineum TaxID=301880 RepID=A0ABQ4XXS7_9ASTR
MGRLALDASNTTITLEEIDGFVILRFELRSKGGEVVGKQEHGEGVLIAEIELSAIDHQRQLVPLQKHRRHDMYRLLQVEEQTP